MLRDNTRDKSAISKDTRSLVHVNYGGCKALVRLRMETAQIAIVEFLEDHPPLKLWRGQVEWVPARLVERE